MTPRRAIVEVRFGPLASRRAIIEPGQLLRVGRSNMLGLALPHDGQMSAEHLELSWDGERCRVRRGAGFGVCDGELFCCAAAGLSRVVAAVPGGLTHT